MNLFESPLKEATPEMIKYYPIFDTKTKSRFKQSDKKSISTSKKRRSAENEKRIVKRVKRSLPFIDSNEQYAIDAGQKDFDASRCKTCCMLYTMGEMVDEKTHAEYHDVFVKSIKFNGWKNEDVLENYSDGRIIRVLPNHRKNMHKKVDDLFVVADMELGIRVDLNSSMKPSSVYLLFANEDKRIAGFVAAEKIQFANKLLSEDPFIASTEQEEAECGVTRLWTHPQYRRKRVASRLLDALRTHFIVGRIIHRTKVAFTDPTNNGAEFAKFYTGRNDFLIFQYDINSK